MERCLHSAGSSLSPRPASAGSAGSCAAGRPTGTGKSLQNTKREQRRVLVEEEEMGECVSVNKSQHYLWRFVVHGPASLGKLFHVFEYLVFHFRRQAGKLL